jgi:glycosyltransferase involved in cell wall biosynthesis
VAAYNQGRHLSRCLDSLRDQTMPSTDYEVIVVDDGSSDETPEILKERGSDLRVLTLPANRGLPAACNAGLDVANAAYVMRVDSDDWIEPDALLPQRNVLDAQPEIDIVVTDHWRVTEAGRVRRSPDPGNVFTWIATGCMMRKARVEEAGGYRPLYWEEYDLYLRMLERGATLVRLEQPVLSYRAHDESMTARESARLGGWRELLDAWPLETLRRWGRDDEMERVVGEELAAL